MPSRGSGLERGGGENDIVAHSYDHGAVGLLGQFSGFKRDSFTAGEINRNFLFHCLSFEEGTKSAMSCELRASLHM